jgi:hypothetical protein
MRAWAERYVARVQPLAEIPNNLAGVDPEAPEQGRGASENCDEGTSEDGDGRLA